jgi:hypothetical protein
MTTKTLTESLRELKVGEVDWKFAIYGTKKSRDGLELEWNVCKMRGIADWVETLRTTMLETTLLCKAVKEYSPLDNESIGAIAKSDPIIREQIVDTLLNIKNGLPYAPESFTTGELPRPVGVAFYGEYVAESDGESEIKQVLFMRRGNPFVSGAKTRICTSNGSEVVLNDKPILKFATAVDFIFIDDICYFNSPAIEKDFAMENRHLAYAATRLELISTVEIVSNFDKLVSVAMTPRNAKKFLSFDEQILEHIEKMGIVKREEFLSTYGIAIDHKGLMDTRDDEQCELIIDLLCCRSVVDPLGRLAIGSNITPRG